MERTRNPNLTPCELAVAQLVVTGRTNVEVAALIGRSVNTIKTHLRHAYKKLGVRNRTELVEALRCGHGIATELSYTVDSLGNPVQVYRQRDDGSWAPFHEPLIENTPV